MLCSGINIPYEASSYLAARHEDTSQARNKFWFQTVSDSNLKVNEVDFWQNVHIPASVAHKTGVCHHFREKTSAYHKTIGINERNGF